MPLQEICRRAQKEVKEQFEKCVNEENRRKRETVVRDEFRLV